MEDFVIDEGVLVKCLTDKKCVLVPNGITAIGKEAFAFKKETDEVILPSTLKRIEKSAFRLSRIKRLTLPSGLEYIGDSAFFGCMLLSSIVIPGTVEEIGNSAFALCDGLDGVVFLNGVKVIANGAFEYCRNIDQVCLPPSIERIEARAFANCQSLEKIYIPKSVTYVGEQAFSSCEEIKIYREDGVKDEGWHRDWNCRSYPVFDDLLRKG